MDKFWCWLFGHDWVRKSKGESPKGFSYIYQNKCMRCGLVYEWWEDK